MKMNCLEEGDGGVQRRGGGGGGGGGERKFRKGLTYVDYTGTSKKWSMSKDRE